ncbi:expressed unknown protein [Seminavis robusta]|uniref:Uncharacterized protein n=1 Tax=Seminavis robusta TaxID=568900 RepID=A0A9N8HRZ4_9STRA|nr:expressed unknown protein [Seminavis robusta]|eukprot:Sro1328_g263250.1 n/a (172) ;mRNA; r:28981-29496
MSKNEPGFLRNLSLDVVEGGLPLRAIMVPREVDPIVGMIIEIRSGKRSDHSTATNTCCVDIPLSLSASGRHVRERSSSIGTEEMRGQGSDQECERIHPLPRSASLVSLPAKVICLAGSFDRFGTFPSNKEKTDKIMLAPIKSLDCNPQEIPSEISVLPPLTRMIPVLVNTS